MTANNDAKVRLYDAENFASLGCFSFDWSVNVSTIQPVSLLLFDNSKVCPYTILLQNTSVSPDGKLLAVLGDSPDCLLTDANTGRVSTPCFISACLCLLYLILGRGEWGYRNLVLSTK